MYFHLSKTCPSGGGVTAVRVTDSPIAKPVVRLDGPIAEPLITPSLAQSYFTVTALVVMVAVFVPVTPLFVFVITQ
jgi:hypothetical protein